MMAIRDQGHDCWSKSVLVVPVFLMFLLAAPLGCAAEPTPVPPTADLKEPEDFELLDPSKELPELHVPWPGGPNDVRDILVVDDGFMVATGGGILYCRYEPDGPKVIADYGPADGLPSGNCYSLAQDADGGIWTVFYGGVGWLAKGAKRWQTFTEEGSLAPGTVLKVALSSDGRRIWVVSSGGLATALVKDRKWKAYPQTHPIDILLHPSGNVAWCRRLLASKCMCGRHILTSQFDLATESWRDVPETGNCAHVAPEPVCFCAKTGRLWFSGGTEPPLLYDPAKNTIRKWPTEPNWERIADGNVVAYSDWFGQMLPVGDETSKMWFGTGSGLWLYDLQQDRWEQHRWKDDPGCGQPLLARSHDGQTLYWASEGDLATYDIRHDQWVMLWSVKEGYGRGNQTLTVSPDGQFLWWTGLGGVFIGDPKSRKARLLTDKDVPGLSEASFVRFDAKRSLALIATPRGVVFTETSGQLRWTLLHSACPISDRVERLKVSPNGDQVWCLMKKPGGSPGPAAGAPPRPPSPEAVGPQRLSGRPPPPCAGLRQQQPLSG